MRFAADRTGLVSVNVLFVGFPAALGSWGCLHRKSAPNFCTELVGKVRRGGEGQGDDWRGWGGKREMERGMEN